MAPLISLTTDLCVAHVISFVESDAARPAATAVAADGRCVQRIQLVQVIAVARSSAPQW